MGDILWPPFSVVGNTIRRKRTQISRRPNSESQPSTLTNCNYSSPSSTSASLDVNKVSSDENPGYYNTSKRKEFNLNHCVTRVASAAECNGESTLKKIKGQNKLHNGDQRDATEEEHGPDRRRCREGTLAPFNLISSSMGEESQRLGESGMSFDSLGSENRVKKVKLKLGSVTCTIKTKSTSNGDRWKGSSMQKTPSSEFSSMQHSSNLLEDVGHNHSLPNKGVGLRGVPWKDFSIGFNLGKDSSRGKVKHEEKSDVVRKSKRIPKRRMVDVVSDDAEDDEIRYLEKLKTIKVVSGNKDVEQEPSKKSQRAFKNLKDVRSPVSSKDNKNPRSHEVSEDIDYEEEEDPTSDGELEDRKRKKHKKESIQLLMEGKREVTLTTRQRALQLGKDASGAASTIEFPNGLPAAPPRKQKEKLSEVEQQLKKAEAAQRRKIQVEKAAQESEAEAIRKILGQDSSRKKREDKMKKRREEIAQEKAANALVLAPNTIRLVMGPAGTIMTFSNDMGLPKIFNSKPCSYPPPREVCAGPLCSNPYKYRDSKSKLPLCSLQCYKAIQGKQQAEDTW